MLIRKNSPTCFKTVRPSAHSPGGLPDFCYGFTLIEAVIFIALLAVMTTAIISIFFSQSVAWADARALRTATDTARLIADRLTQEIRLATAVTAAQSTFGSSPGRLTLETFESSTSSQPSTATFSVATSTLWIQRGADAAIPLNATGTRVTNLVFYNAPSAESEAIRFTVSIEAAEGSIVRAKNVTGAGVLRGSY